ncbi:ACAD11 [Symbiodinium natans]|uniref:ACAD11 protein n=1 Tax=Symbiodinium natans TaxID=878477 RepID=A0A812NQ16_9DINO|nr:ACAD11 [Symbiodinium natans]
MGPVKRTSRFNAFTPQRDESRPAQPRRGSELAACPRVIAPKKLKLAPWKADEGKPPPRRAQPSSADSSRSAAQQEDDTAEDVRPLSQEAVESLRATFSRRNIIRTNQSVLYCAVESLNQNLPQVGALLTCAKTFLYNNFTDQESWQKIKDLVEYGPSAYTKLEPLLGIEGHCTYNEEYGVIMRTDSGQKKLRGQCMAITLAASLAVEQEKLVWLRNPAFQMVVDIAAQDRDPLPRRRKPAAEKKAPYEVDEMDLADEAFEDWELNPEMVEGTAGEDERAAASSAQTDAAKSELQELNELLEAELADVKEQHATLQKQQLDDADAHAQAVKANEELRGQVQQAEATRKVIEDKLVSLQEQLDEALEGGELARAALSAAELEADEKCRALKEDMEKAAAQQVELAEKRAAKEYNAQLGAKQKEHDKEVAELKQKKDEQEAKAKDLRERMSLQADTIESFQKKLEDANAANLKLQEERAKAALRHAEALGLKQQELLAMQVTCQAEREEKAKLQAECKKSKEAVEAKLNSMQQESEATQKKQQEKIRLLEEQNVQFQQEIEEALMSDKTQELRQLREKVAQVQAYFGGDRARMLLATLGEMPAQVHSLGEGDRELDLATQSQGAHSLGEGDRELDLATQPQGEEPPPWKRRRRDRDPPGPFIAKEAAAPVEAEAPKPLPRPKKDKKAKPSEKPTGELGRQNLLVAKAKARKKPLPTPSCQILDAKILVDDDAQAAPQDISDGEQTQPPSPSPPSDVG